MLCKHLKSITTRVSYIQTWWENHRRITVEKWGSIPCLQRRRCFKLNTDSDRYRRTYAWTALVMNSLHFITVIDTNRYEQNSHAHHSHLCYEYDFALRKATWLTKYTRSGSDINHHSPGTGHKNNSIMSASSWQIIDDVFFTLPIFTQTHYLTLY